VSTDRYAHRRTDARVVVRGADGRPLPDTELSISQVRHAVGFGSTAPHSADVDHVTREWLELFDTATLARFYWGRYEPEPGRTDRDGVLAVARMLAEHGVRLKGHPLVWHTVKAPWLDPLPLVEVERAIRHRVRREVTDFAGLVDVWDVVNEAVIMPRFTNEPDGVPNAVSRLCADVGRVQMVRMAVEEARAAGTRPTLHLNDFDLGPEYERLIADLLDAGVEVDGIGLQSHMHKGFRGEAYLQDVNERFARFGLPLHWTETTLLSGDPVLPHIEDLQDVDRPDWPSTPEGEARQADELERHYRTLVEHPAVASITYWGFADGAMWLGAPGGLLRADGSRKPGYETLHGLIRGEWWLSATTRRTDEHGGIAVDAFAGEFEVSGAAGTGRVSLAAGPVQAEVRLDG
jgi:endo-1,4-beta-xylanase